MSDMLLNDDNNNNNNTFYFSSGPYTIVQIEKWYTDDNNCYIKRHIYSDNTNISNHDIKRIKR